MQLEFHQLDRRWEHLRVRHPPHTFGVDVESRSKPGSIQASATGQLLASAEDRDYHVEVDRHFYSVPYALVHRDVDVHVTAETVEVLHRGLRVASHVRSAQPAKATTLPEHKNDPQAIADAGSADGLRLRHADVQRKLPTWHGPAPFYFAPGDCYLCEKHR